MLEEYASGAAYEGRKDLGNTVAGDGKHAEMREVQVGRAIGADRQVTSGLAAGDSVVLDPPAELQDGGRIETQAE